MGDSRKKRQRTTDAIELLSVPFEIAKMVKKKREANLMRVNSPHFTKKKLRELRAEAKELGFKVEGKKGPDGLFHIYLVKGTYRRQWS